MISSSSTADATVLHCTVLDDVDINCTSAPKTCPCTKRVIVALKEYQTLDTCDSASNATQASKSKLLRLYKEQHRRLLDDFIHILDEHNNDIDLHSIHNMLLREYQIEACDVKQCSSTTRHHRDRQKDIESMQQHDETYVFSRDLLDQIHFFLLHLYDSGQRIKRIEKESDVKKDEDEDESWLDHDFAKMCSMVQNNNNAPRYQTNKFSILTNNTQETEETFLDGMYSYIIGRAPVQNILNVCKWICCNDYDSDTLQFDIERRGRSNIKKLHKATHDVMKEYTLCVKLHKSTFSTGYRFYYWDYYKDKSTNADPYQFGRRNVNSHGEHAPNALYIHKKYVDLKDEILHNEVFSLDQKALRMSIHKANEYICTSKAKQITASPYNAHEKELNRDRRLHYGIQQGSILSYNHLLSMILYCDWSELCAQFSSTFRKWEWNDTLFEIKQRNREYAIWSRLLRETVEIFGISAVKDNNDQVLSGPFFCGMDFEMLLPEYDIRLCGPTSTSKHIEIATRFAGNHGIIIKLSNTVAGFWVNQLTAFSCVWLSDYASEDEWFFFGGQFTIKLQSIRLKSTKQNFEAFFGTLYHFDAMLNGTKTRRSATQSERNLLSNLISYSIHQTEGNKYPKYIHDTFETYTNYKTQLIIDIPMIRNYYGKLSDFALSESQTQEHAYVFNPTLLTLFRNINKVIMNTEDPTISRMVGRCGSSALAGRIPNKSTIEWQTTFDLSDLLIILNSKSIVINHGFKVVAISYRGRDKSSWLIHQIKPDIVSQFKQHHFSITVEPHKRTDRVTISKYDGDTEYIDLLQYGTLNDDDLMYLFPLTDKQIHAIAKKTSFNQIIKDMNAVSSDIDHSHGSRDNIIFLQYARNIGRGHSYCDMDRSCCRCAIVISGSMLWLQPQGNGDIRVGQIKEAIERSMGTFLTVYEVRLKKQNDLLKPRRKKKTIQKRRKSIK